MEAEHFDDLTKRLAQPISRSAAVKATLAAAFGGMFSLSKVTGAAASTSRCCDGEILCNGKCVPKASKAKNLEAGKGANKGATARAKPRAERQSAQAPSQPAYDPPSGGGGGRGGGRGGRGRGWVGKAIRSGSQ